MLIHNYKELREIIERYISSNEMDNSLVFRGQSKECWSLETSLLRLLKNKKMSVDEIEEFETRIIKLFRKVVPEDELSKLTFSSSEDNQIAWLMYMQQYSAPTRLLDWSFSPWVALYFACNSNPDDNGKIWITDNIQANKLVQPKTQNFLKQMSPESKTDLQVIYFAEPDYLPFERIQVQKAIFSYSPNPFTSHEKILQKNGNLETLIIPKELKPIILLELFKKGFTAKNLFLETVIGPDGIGVDGVGQTIFDFYTMWLGGVISINEVL